jgi:Domain of unknown function (DUF1707)/2TM domain
MDREVPPELVRVGDDERERVVTALHEHASRGRLDPEELDSRVEQALRARTRSDLAGLLRDLPAEQPAASAPARPRRAVLRFRRNAGIFAVMAVFFIAIWAAGGGGSFWPVWPILGWGIALGIQGVKLLTAGDDADEPGDEPDALPRGA